ncbi:hypothetical protein [Streptomyces sp. DH20]|uniref:hypothetical protein n=1 Tax=Streptomyces sp. DH20 TaxID=2857009 RepID=UPI001E5294CC|nr:hypothetical protein [Streptomyces sp. DH20]
MSMCAVCRRATQPGLHACPRHTAELRAWLAELPGQTRLLEREFLAPAAAPAQGRIGGTGRATAPVPVDLRVVTLLGPGHADILGADDDGTVPILAWLGAWAGYIAYTYPAVTRDPYGTAHVQPCDQAWPRHHETTAGYCVWLTRYLPYAAAHPWVGDLHRQLEALIDRVRDLTHAVPHRHPQGAPCPKCDAHALVAVDGQLGITCDSCGHHLDIDTYAAHAAAFLHTHQTTAGDATPAAAPPHTTHERTKPMSRVTVRVLLLLGDQAEIVADVPPAERAEPVRYPAADVAAAAGVPVADLPGRRLTAEVGDDDQLSGWRVA